MSLRVSAAAVCSLLASSAWAFASVDAGQSGVARARSLLRDGRYAAAEAAARQALEQATEPLDVVRAMDPLVDALVRGGKARLPETAELARRAVAIAEDVPGAESADLPAAIFRLAEQLRMSGTYAEAETTYLRALRLRESAVPADPGALSESLHGLGTLRIQSTAYDEARVLVERALSLAEAASGAGDRAVARLLVDLARLHRLGGDLAEAKPLLQRALAIQERLTGADHVDTASTLGELGELLRTYGDYEAARSAFDRALAIRESVLGPDSLEVADALNGLGILLRRTGSASSSRCPEAVPVCRRALAIAERVLGPDHPELARYLEGLGWAVFQCSKDHFSGAGEAGPLFARSLALLERTFGPSHLACADSLEGLAQTAAARGAEEDAVRRYRQKLAIERAALRPDHPALSFTLFQMAYVEVASLLQNQPVTTRDEILAHALEAERIEREHVRGTSRRLPERDALAVAFRRWRGGLHVALTLAELGLEGPGRRRAWEAVVRSRALTLDTMASRNRAVRGSGDPELERLAREAESARRDLARQAVRGALPSQADRRRRENAERELAFRSATSARELERSALGADEVLAHLPSDTALVSYVLHYRWPLSDPLEKYVAFVVRAGDPAPTFVSLGSMQEIDRLVAAWRDRASVAPGDEGAEAASRAAGERLRRAIWDPLAGHVGDARRVLLVPAGQLHTVSFAALPSGRGGYLVEEPFVLHYLSSERDVVPSPASVGEGLLAIGGPEFEASPGGAAPPGVYRGRRSSRESFRSLRFDPLPEAQREARSLAALWPGRSELLLGAQASEAAFKRLAPGRRILHIATHGFFLGEAESAIPENPLLLSGLALAGANRREAAGPDEEDGILTADEISALDLSRVEWAVLSACDTGSGDILAGEGVVGLQRALQVAGARTVLMSLWPVDDKATRRFMERLYGWRMRDGLDVASAMRRAMLAALADRRRKGLSTHPFHWAAFVAAGDWR